MALSTINTTAKDSVFVSGFVSLHFHSSNFGGLLERFNKK